MSKKIKKKGKMDFYDFDDYSKLYNRKVVILSSKDMVVHNGDDYRINKETLEGIVYIYFSYDLNHYHLITNINAFTTNSKTNNSKFCSYCEKSIDDRYFNFHKCEKEKCCLCSCYGKHKDIKKTIKCNECNINCYNQECLTEHIKNFHTNKLNGKIKNYKYWFCNSCYKKIDKERLEDHLCGEEKCLNYEEYHFPHKNIKIHGKNEVEHRCNILCGKINKFSGGEDQTYYAFDFESKFDNGIHIVNLIVVEKLYDNKQFKFYNLDEFIKWSIELEESSTLLAHNFKGYDGVLMLNRIKQQMAKKPDKIVMAGAKVMYMKFGKVRFLDSLNFIPSTLSGMPKMFGLNNSVMFGNI
mgnify:FL=1